jgi:hypothetical protein
MISIFPVLIKYLYVWLMTCVLLSSALISEIAYTVFLRLIRGQRKDLLKNIPVIKMLAPFSHKTVLPETSCKTVALLCPAAAFALLFPIYANIPVGTGVPMIDNGGDLIQIMSCVLLSSVFAIVAVGSLGTENCRHVVSWLMKDTIVLFLPLIICFASMASYFESVGVAGDPFSLSLFATAVPLNTMGIPGITGAVIFIFVIFSQLQHNDMESGCILLDDGELPDYRGVQRVFLQLWGLAMPYVIILLTAHIFFPWSFFSDDAHGAVKSFAYNFLGFIVFWLMIVFLRVVVVTFCWKLMAFIEKHLPCRLKLWILPVLIIIAMSLIYYDSIKVSAELMAF